MKFFWERFTHLLMMIWVGSLLTLGAIVAPVLFSALNDKQLAGMLAGKMFAVGAWVGMVAGTFLLTDLRWARSAEKSFLLGGLAYVATHRSGAFRHTADFAVA